MSKQMTVAIAGLGSRGRDTYAKVAKLCSDKMKIVAIADIDPEKVRLTAGEYGIPKARCYASAEEMLQEEKLADAMISNTGQTTCRTGCCSASERLSPVTGKTNLTGSCRVQKDFRGGKRM